MIQLNSLHLFAGIGGCALGMQRAGVTPIGLCDNSPHAQAILRKHWPDVPLFGDVKTLKGSDFNERVDIITGGFPCQDISYANRDAVGISGSRSGLWFEQLRLIDELRPGYVLGENVSALRTRGLDVLLGSLASIGYDAEWHCIPACYLGAWHKRDRIWILAYPNGDRLPERRTEGPILRQPHLSWPLTGVFAQWPGRSNLPSSRLLRSLDGVPAAAQRLIRLGNSCVPVIPEMFARAIIANELLS